MLMTGCEIMQGIIISVLFVIGLVIIIKGGDLFVDAAIWIAKKTGVPSILIGATIVSLATTLPELFVSTIASLHGYTDMAIGNALGSTICNIGFILGLGALISPIPVRRKFFSIKAFMMIVSLISFYSLAYDKVVTKFEGMLLLLLLGVYIMINILEVKYSNHGNSDYMEIGNSSLVNSIFKFILGSALIILGARLLVDNGVKIAKLLDVPEQTISLTLIALGTSLPELVTSIVALIKGHRGMAVGNIIGANIINITMVLGISSLVAQSGLAISTRNINFADKILKDVPQALVLDIPMSFFMMIILLLAGTFHREIGRMHGLFLLLVYFSYLGILAAIS